MRNAEIIGICFGLCLTSALAAGTVAYRIGRDTAPEIVAHRRAVAERLSEAIPEYERDQVCEDMLDAARQEVLREVPMPPDHGPVADPFN